MVYFLRARPGILAIMRSALAMLFADGARLGPYEIVSLLGSGGMGEVYRARDSRLNRFIALKVLPAAAALDPERRDRFEAEARAVAALNHPHIVTIHSVETVGGVTLLTMELVEGRALSDDDSERRPGCRRGPDRLPLRWRTPSRPPTRKASRTAT